MLFFPQCRKQQIEAASHAVVILCVHIALQRLQNAVQPFFMFQSRLKAFFSQEKRNAFVPKKPVFK